MRVPHMVGALLVVAVFGATLVAQCPTTVITTFPHTEDFESSPSNNTQIPPADWTQDPSDGGGTGNADWFFRTGSTSSTNTGPSGDHTSGSGYYAYVEDSGNEHPATNLDSPCFNVSSLTSPALRFWFHSYDGTNGAASPNMLFVDILEYVGGMSPPVVTQVFSTGHTALNDWEEAIIDLSPFAASNFQVRFRGSNNNGTFTHDNAIDDVFIGEGSAFDVGISSIDSPTDQTCGMQLSATEPIMVTVRNFGVQAVPGFTVLNVQYTIDAGTPVTDTVNVPMAGLPVGGTLQHTFATPANLAMDGTSTIVAETTDADGDAANNATTEMVVTGVPLVVTSFPFVEDFENLPDPVDNTQMVPQCWENVAGDAGGSTSVNADWYFRSTPTSSANTGPTADHTTGVSGQGFYGYVEDTQNSLDVLLRTPQLDLAQLANPALCFFLWNEDSAGGANQNFLSVDVIDITNGSTTTMDVGGPTGHLGAGWMQQVLGLGNFAGSIVQLQFRVDCTNSGNNTFTDDVAIDDVMVGEGSLFDVGITSIDSPVDVTACSTQLSATENIVVSIFNFSANALAGGTTLNVEYQIDAQTPVADVATIPMAGLNPGQSFQHTFATPANLAMDGTVSITARTTDPDDDSGNDATTAMVVTGIPGTITTYPYLETFDNSLPTPTNGTQVPPMCWVNDPNDSSASSTSTATDWFFRNASTPSTNSGPPADHTTGVSGQGFYAHIEDSSNFDPINLITPTFDFSSVATPAMRFYVWNNDDNLGAEESVLHVDVLDVNSMIVTPDVIPPIGHIGPQWTETLVSLSAFAGQQVQIIFRGNTVNGDFTDDVAIDDIEVFDNMMVGNGQPPIPGLSVMDINDARDAVGFPVTGGLPGPYFTTVTAGGTMTFSFEGEPSQPIVLLLGPLNPGAFLLLPLAGQLDIGMFNPMQGLTGVVLVGAGTGNGFFDLLLNTQASGTTSFTFTVPVNASGFHQAFQALIFASGAVVISPTNAVDLTIM